MQLVDVLRVSATEFDAKFPEFRIWLQYKTSAMVSQEWGSLYVLVRVGVGACVGVRREELSKICCQGVN